MWVTWAFTVPSISAIGRGTISQNGNLFLVTKLESRKQSEDPKSTSPLKANRTSREWMTAYKELWAASVAALRCRVGPPVRFRQLAPGGVRGLRGLFFGVQVQ